VIFEIFNLCDDLKMLWDKLEKLEEIVDKVELYAEILRKNRGDDKCQDIQIVIE
jgi:hypothetical protein